MSETITIALNRLRPWKGNVPHTAATDGIDELHPRSQTRQARDRRRQRLYLALKLLARDRTVAKDHPVPCILADDAMDASELSLAENVVGVPMHPADQFQAFRTVIDTGLSVTEVAARFGVTEQFVARRLKLGRLSPVILDACRNGRIDLDDTQAFAICDDHAEQERVFNDLPEWLPVSPLTLSRHERDDANEWT